MKSYNWKPSKNQTLIAERSVSFKSVVFHLQNNGLIDDIKYPDQRVYIVNIDDYIYLVPYVESDDEIFLKTIIPSRKATRKYLGESK